ncbi:hypothetical protein BDR07DRAFT_1461313 [Suillus spraguei]|nr:hypothetical protein BDR07DRAFT_1461313 [Suillus spraguei]
MIHSVLRACRTSDRTDGPVQKVQCPGGGDVRAFLDELHAKRDELSAVGVQIEEKDYRSTIIQSLPNHLASFASGQLATARLYSITKTIDPDILISLIIEESECQNRKDSCPSRGNTSTHHARENEAMALMDVSCRGQPVSMAVEGRTMEGTLAGASACHAGTVDRVSTFAPNLKNHLVPTLTQPEALQTQQLTKTPKTMLSSPWTQNLPAPSQISFPSTTFVTSDEDWFSEIDEEDSPQISNWEIEPAAPHSESNTDSCMEVTAKVANEHTDTTIVELYDSGTTRHISPYHDQFTTLTPIPPKMFAAANKQRFDATGIGELVIEVPMV